MPVPRLSEASRILLIVETLSLDALGWFLVHHLVVGVFGGGGILGGAGALLGGGALAGGRRAWGLEATSSGGGGRSRGRRAGAENFLLGVVPVLFWPREAQLSAVDARREGGTWNHASLDVPEAVGRVGLGVAGELGELLCVDLFRSLPVSRYSTCRERGKGAGLSRRRNHTFPSSASSLQAWRVTLTSLSLRP